MIAMKSHEFEPSRVTSIDYKGRPGEVKGVMIRWLSKEGQDESGAPAYGLRLFTVEPAGVIPIHNHQYMQTMYIVSGEFECWTFDPESDEIIASRICGPGDAIYIPSMEPHGMRNISDTQPGEFLCCICTLHPSQAKKT